MRVIATATGYFDKVRQAGEQFDVPQGTKGSWFVPEQADVKAKASGGKPTAKPEAGTGSDDLV